MRVRRRGVAAAVLTVAAALALTACSTAPAASSGTAAPHSGTYPVAVAGAQVTALQQVSTGGYALVAAGDPVEARLQDADLRITVAGPDVEVPQPAPGQPISAPDAPGVLTVTVTALRGSMRIDSRQFLGLNEDQARFALHADRTSGTASVGHPVTLQLRSRFASGHTTLTWQPAGKPLITWDFTIEID